MKCLVCGNNQFCAHQVVRMDVICDENGTFLSNVSENPAADIYDVEKPYGPFTCTLCGAEYDELDGTCTLTQEQKNRALEQLWLKLGDVPINPETEQLLEDFGPFQKNDDKYEDVLRWFDQRYSKAVVGLLGLF